VNNYELIKKAAKEITGKLTPGEIAADVLLSGAPVGPIITATKAEKGKKLKTFGHTAGRGLGYGTLGLLGGLGISKLLRRKDLGLPIAIGSIGGLLKGHAVGKRKAQELGYLKKD
jgi:hypothetical protein